METAADTDAVLLAAGLIFLWALLLGVWKYRGMAASPEGRAHPYVDIAHRAALLYSFATLLIAVFVELSGWSQLVDLICAFVLVGFFVAAIGAYAVNGYRAARPTTSSARARDPRPARLHVGADLRRDRAFAVLLAGFASARSSRPRSTRGRELRGLSCGFSSSGLAAPGPGSRSEPARSRPRDASSASRRRWSWWADRP